MASVDRPPFSVDIVEVYEWINGEYVFGVTVTVAPENRLNDSEMDILLYWLSQEYGRDDWVLSAIEEPA